MRVRWIGSVLAVSESWTELRAWPRTEIAESGAAEWIEKPSNLPHAKRPKGEKENTVNLRRIAQEVDHMEERQAAGEAVDLQRLAELRTALRERRADALKPAPEVERRPCSATY